MQFRLNLLNSQLGNTGRRLHFIEYKAAFDLHLNTSIHGIKFLRRSKVIIIIWLYNVHELNKIIK